jgi:hypothetical protein
MVAGRITAIASFRGDVADLCGHFPDCRQYGHIGTGFGFHRNQGALAHADSHARIPQVFKPSADAVKYFSLLSAGVYSNACT